MIRIEWVDMSNSSLENIAHSQPSTLPQNAIENNQETPEFKIAPSSPIPVQNHVQIKKKSIKKMAKKSKNINLDEKIVDSGPKSCMPSIA